MRSLDRYSLEQRKNVFISVMGVFFLLLLWGFFRLQVLNTDFYVQKSIDNSVRKIVNFPVRGLIYDRNGRILVDNRPSFSVAVIPKVVTKKTVEKTAGLLQLPVENIYESMRKQYGFRPVIVERDVDYKIVINLEENRLSYPGVITVMEPKRYYPQGINSPHIFGTIGEVTTDEQRKNPRYEAGDMIGKTALEKFYDQDLRGSKGVRYVSVDASGRELGELDENRDINPLHGGDLHLNLDYTLQAFAESLMVDVRGALVALDTRTGGVISMVSKPDYDPRLLTGKIDPDSWNSLLTDDSHPLYSRAIQSVYPPGSTYKIVAAIAALQEGIITPSWKATCPGYFRIGRKIVHCWNAKGHGTIDLHDAIRGSCNVYFYQLGLKIGLQIWAKYSKMFAFGRPTGIDLPNESKGLVPTESYFNKRYGENGWTKGNLANLAIGQGELLVTPLQMAQFVMILANKGVYHTPHLLNYVYDHASLTRTFYPSDTKYVTGVSDRTYNVVREAMRSVVENGTGWNGKVPGIVMAGKTGTAQNPHGNAHAWFMAFAPFDNPEIAISVIVENGGHGGSVAAPIARKFMEKYFFGHEIPRVYKPKEDIPLETQPIDSIVAPIDLQKYKPLQIPNGRHN